MSAPAPVMDLDEIGVEAELVADLALKLGYTVPHFTTDWCASRLRLPLNLVEDLLHQLKSDRMLEILGQTGPFNYRYAVTDRGRERARQLLEISGYVGPAPVSLEAYGAFLDWQLQRFPKLTAEAVRNSLDDLVLKQATA